MRLPVLHLGIFWSLVVLDEESSALVPGVAGLMLLPSSKNFGGNAASSWIGHRSVVVMQMGLYDTPLPPRPPPRDDPSNNNGGEDEDELPATMLNRKDDRSPEKKEESAASTTQQELETFKEKLKLQEQKRKRDEYFSGGKRDADWLPQTNPKPLDDEPWFTG
jgi:hypothetical protein